MPFLTSALSSARSPLAREKNGTVELSADPTTKVLPRIRQASVQTKTSLHKTLVDRVLAGDRTDAVVLRTQEQANELDAMRNRRGGEKVLQSSGMMHQDKLNVRTRSDGELQDRYIRQGGTVVLGAQFARTVEQKKGEAWTARNGFRSRKDKMTKDDQNVDFLCTYVQDTSREKQPPTVRIRIDSLDGISEESAIALLTMARNNQTRVGITFADPRFKEKMFQIWRSDQLKQQEQNPPPAPGPLKSAWGKVKGWFGAKK